MTNFGSLNIKKPLHIDDCLEFSGKGRVFKIQRANALIPAEMNADSRNAHWYPIRVIMARVKNDQKMPPTPEPADDNPSEKDLLFKDRWAGASLVLLSAWFCRGKIGERTGCCRNENNTRTYATKNPLGENKGRDCTAETCTDKCTTKNDATTEGNLTKTKDFDRSSNRYPNRECQSHASGSNKGYQLWDIGRQWMMV